MFSRSHEIEPVQPIRRRRHRRRLRQQAAHHRPDLQQADLVTAGRSYFGGLSAARAPATVALAIPTASRSPAATTHHSGAAA